MKTVLAAAAISILAAQPALAGHRASPPWQYGSMAGADLGDNANLNGAVPFPSDNAWNTDISQSDVDPNSDNLISPSGFRPACIPISAAAPMAAPSSASLTSSSPTTSPM